MSNIPYAARKAMMVALIEEIESNDNVRAIYVTVLAQDMRTPNALPMVDVPVEKMNEDGTIVLNIGVSAVGYRKFYDEGIVVSMRFNGRERQMVIPYCLIASVVGIDYGNVGVVQENFTVFLPAIDAAVDKSFDEEGEACTSEDGHSGNKVVSLFRAK